MIDRLDPPLRVRLEQEENTRLSPLAARSTQSRGRERFEEACPMRTAYMRDRDRIIHSKAFRRLKHKTQVFLAPKGDHYRTRLTHTLEVTQISRTIARCLGLNEDLTEAIGLGHDLGHTPFGHIGEDALTSTGRLPRPFHHNEQSVRIVENIEYDGKGLNLTWEVRDGILNHSGSGSPSTLEGWIVKISDRIAYVNHDIDDAIRAGVLEEAQLPQGPIALFGRYPSQRINAMVQDLVAESLGKPLVRMSDEGWTALSELRSFMFENVYTASEAKAENEKAIHVLCQLFEYYWARPDELPSEFQPAAEDDKSVKIADYVAGMTDQFAINSYKRLFLPDSWKI